MSLNPSWRSLQLTSLKLVAFTWLVFGIAATLMLIGAWWREGLLSTSSGSTTSYLIGIVFSAGCIKGARQLFHSQGQTGRRILIGLSVLALFYCFSYLAMVGPAFGLAWLVAVWALFAFALISVIVLATPLSKPPSPAGSA